MQVDASIVAHKHGFVMVFVDITDLSRAQPSVRLEFRKAATSGGTLRASWGYAGQSVAS